MVAASLTTASCVNDEAICPDTAASQPGKVTLRINLNLGEMGHLSRGIPDLGIWNPEDDTMGGSTFDNTIKMNESDKKWLHVMLIKNVDPETFANDEILHLNLDEGFQFNPVEGGYDMTATLDLSDPELRAKWGPGTYRVMILANQRDRTSDSEHIRDYKTLGTLRSYLDGLRCDWYNDGYNDNRSRNVGNVPYIPMWGIATVDLKLEENQTESFSIDLLRSVAKVKVEFSDRLKEVGYKINKCEASNVVKKIFYMPSWWHDLASTTYPYVYYDMSLHADGNKVKDSNGKNLVTVNYPGFNNEHDDDGSLVFYLPESADNNGVELSLDVEDETGEPVECPIVKIDNCPDDYNSHKYTNGRYCINRNHLYRIILDRDLVEGTLSYKVVCWDYEPSEIGWNAVEYEFNSGDTESQYGYVCMPSYNSSSSKKVIENTTSFADYTFTLTKPAGAVWKAFLIEDGVEYAADKTFRETPDGGVKYSSAANTPNGFFFGVGNDDDNNNRAASTGIARPEPYNIKVGTRLAAVNFNDKEPYTLEENSNIVALNSNGLYWKNRGEVPTCYLVIKIALDGKNFTEELAINPTNGVKSTDLFYPYKFAGTATRIELRNLFQIYRSKDHKDDSKLIKGIENTGKNDADYREYTWWSYPMNHKDSK